MGGGALQLTLPVDGSGAVFFYGTLRHAPLLEAVLGRPAGSLAPARLEGHAVLAAAEGPYPVIRAAPGAAAAGLLATGLTETDLARLDFYEAGFGYVLEDREVEAGAGRCRVRVYLPQREIAAAGPWRLEDWAARWGEAAVGAAREMMALRGTRAPSEIFRRYPQILARAAARVRAAQGAPATLRRRSAPADVAVAAWRQPYAAFFAVEEMDLRFRRFDGAMSPEVTRAVFVSGDAATVLPYDPGRDRVLVIEQFRPGPHARGDAQPWLLEPIAGRVDAGESPEETARREAVEEAGVSLGRLVPVASYYPSPAGKAEYIFSYIGLADLPDALAGRVGGVAGEVEDIRCHLIAFDRLMELVRSGEVENGPLLISALFLSALRPKLRGTG